MNLAELRAEVYTITNRPDLVAQTLTAIRAATLKIHQRDYFYKDLFETGISFTTSDYTQQIEYRTLIPKWRSLKYIRKTDSTGTEQGAFFDVIVPENVLDDYKLNRSNICYVAGEVVQLRSKVEIQYAILGCYVNPDITEATYNSWVAIDHPYAIIFEAASLVFKMVGDTEQFAAYSDLAGMQLQEVVISNVQSFGQ
jgi:hypothetical protein